MGSVENQGIEFGLNAVAIDKEALTWNVGVILAYNRNEILSLDGADSPTFRGYPTGGISGGVGNNIQVLRVGRSGCQTFPTRCRVAIAQRKHRA